MSTLTATETKIDGYIFCPDGRCPGNTQEPVQIIRTEVSHPYEGSTPGFERSMDYLKLDQGDLACPHCGKDRLISDQERPHYLNISGHDPLGLLDLQNKTGSELAAMRKDQEARSTEMDELRESVSQLTELVVAQAKLLEDSKAKPKAAA